LGDTTNFNASINMEPSISKIYNQEYLSAKASKAGISVEFDNFDPTEIKIVQRDIENVPKLILSSDFQNIKILDV
jgi:hypothetical protein